MTRLWTLFRKDMRVVLRSRLLLVVLVLYPLVIVGIIGYAFSDPKQKVPLAVLNLDIDEDGDPNVAIIEDPFSGDFVATKRVSSASLVDALDLLTDVKRVTDREHGQRLLLQGEVQAVLIFPQGFVDKVARFGNEQARLEIIVDQSDPVRATIMEISIRGVVQQFQEEVTSEKVDIVVDALEDTLRRDLPTGHAAYPGFERTIEELERLRAGGNLNETELQRVNTALTFLNSVRVGVVSSVDIVRSVAQPVFVDLQQESSGHLFVRDLVVPAALGLSIFWTGSLATAALIVYERESPAFARLGVTPTGRLTILGSKVALTSIIILLQAMLILGAAVAGFDTRADNVGLTLLLVVLSTFASIGLGVFLSGITRDVNGAVLLSVLVTFPMLFLSGLFYPVEFMPAGAQALAGAFPLTYTVAGLRGSMLRGFGLVDALVPIVALTATGFVLMVAGVVLGRRYERRR